MDFFLLVDLILYFLIISHSYRLICKDQINRKELFFFGAYTLLTEIVLDFPFIFYI
ncbi:histidine kinase [Streptococcus pneumoniae]|nr:histidine kinase [Streptococcus pneumoniae]